MGQVEEEPGEERQRQLGEPGEQMKGEREVWVGAEMKGVDSTGTAEQEGWEVELQGPELGSGGEVGQVELVEAECHRLIPHYCPLHCLQGAESVHAHGHWREHVSVNEQELQDQV